MEGLAVLLEVQPEGICGGPNPPSENEKIGFYNSGTEHEIFGGLKIFLFSKFYGYL